LPCTIVPNSSTTMAALVKTLKRTMAAEYSRELSAKVLAGQCRLTELGLRQGGTAGYGFRRLLIDRDGNRKCVLRRGEQKSILTDRVILLRVAQEACRIWGECGSGPKGACSMIGESDSD
jgi:hypothetical protein